MQKVDNMCSTSTMPPQRSLEKTPVFLQPKLSVNQPGDVYEQQADATADKVMRGDNQAMGADAFFKAPASGVQCMEASQQTENYTSSLDGGGRPLTKNEKNFFEPKFGYDFSTVRLHTDAQAQASAKSINARAYTTGNNIVFGGGQYQEGKDDSKHLLAHELTHVIQQQQAPQMIQRERELNADESKDCLAKVDAAISALESRAADESKNLPDYIKEAVKVLREKRTAGKIKCYAFDGIKHGRVDYAKDEIQYDGVNTDQVNETTVLHEAVHAMHGKQYAASAKKYGKATSEGKQVDGSNASDLDPLKWKAWTEYWAYRSSQDYHNDTQHKTDDEIHNTVMKIHEVIVAVNNVRTFDQSFDPRTWKPK